MPIEYYLLIAGVILMSVELAVPGFGIFGIGGLICLTGGGYFLLGGGFPALTVLLGFKFIKNNGSRGTNGLSNIGDGIVVFNIAHGMMV